MFFFFFFTSGDAYAILSLQNEEPHYKAIVKGAGSLPVTVYIIFFLHICSKRIITETKINIF